MFEYAMNKLVGPNVSLKPHKKIDESKKIIEKLLKMMMFLQLYIKKIIK